mgnify:CR=1 FL=1
MKIDKLENFSKQIKGKFFFNYDLKKTNWFNIGGKAKVYFKPESLNELISFLKEFGKTEKFFILGAGSNILINDGIFNGVVIKLGKNFSNISLLPNKTIVAGSATSDKNLSEFALENKNIYPDQIQVQSVKKALQTLRKSVPKENIEPVSPFYAVLMMDGDSLGSHMSDPDKQTKISDGLEKFTEGVPAIVEKNSGFLIYAGGDDVLALLPLEYALNCANELRTHYLECFSAYPDINTTLSGAIEYAHIKMPLGKVLGDAHHLLDDIAKDQTGRDAIAVRVWKPGGQHLQWAMPWKRALNKQGQVIIDQLARDFQQDQQETTFSNSFFFHAEERFSSLQSQNKQGEKHLGDDFSKDTMIKLISAEYLNSGVHQGIKISLEQAVNRVTPLLEQCFSVKRTPPDDENGIEESCQETQQLNTKALQFIRFLAQKGVEHG